MKLDLLHKEIKQKKKLLFSFLNKGKILLIFLSKEKSKMNIEANAYLLYSKNKFFTNYKKKLVS